MKLWWASARVRRRWGLGRFPGLAWGESRATEAGPRWQRATGSTVAVVASTLVTKTRWPSWGKVWPSISAKLERVLSASGSELSSSSGGGGRRPAGRGAPCS